MKQRRFWAVLLGILLLVSVTVAASAESGGKLPYVTDAANLLTDEQHMALEARAEEISQTYSFGIYIIAVNDYTNSRQPRPTENRSSGSSGGSVTTSHSTGSHSGRTGKF